MSDPSDSRDLVLQSNLNGVTTLTMNMPKRYNGWTASMMQQLRDALEAATHDPETKVLVLTGADPYYCAGVNLSGTLKLDHPKKLHASIVDQNSALFNLFLEFPKPILIAVNGPAIGASVTSATLCDAIIASEHATFSTPFAKLGVPYEGCSSLMFPLLFGEEVATRMLDKEGWVPNAAEAKEFGMVAQVVPHEDLMKEAQKLAESWVKAKRPRTYRGGVTLAQLQEVNAKESQALATAFLSPPFLEGQYRFLASRKKTGPAMMFFLLWKTHPLWSLMLD